jgi:hypothetical protein
MEFLRKSRGPSSSLSSVKVVVVFYKITQTVFEQESNSKIQDYSNGTIFTN